MAMLAKNFGRLMRNEQFKKNFSEKIKKVPKEAEPEEAEKKDPRGPRFLNAQGLGISGLIVGISSKARGRLITRLSVMSPRRRSS